MPGEFLIVTVASQPRTESWAATWYSPAAPISPVWRREAIRARYPLRAQPFTNLQATGPPPVLAKGRVQGLTERPRTRGRVGPRSSVGRAGALRGLRLGLGRAAAVNGRVEDRPELSAAAHPAFRRRRTARRSHAASACSCASATGGEGPPSPPVLPVEPVRLRRPPRPPRGGRPTGERARAGRQGEARLFLSDLAVGARDRVALRVVLDDLDVAPWRKARAYAPPAGVGPGRCSLPGQTAATMSPIGGLVASVQSCSPNGRPQSGQRSSDGGKTKLMRLGSCSPGTSRGLLLRCRRASRSAPRASRAPSYPAPRPVCRRPASRNASPR